MCYPSSSRAKNLRHHSVYCLQFFLICTTFHVQSKSWLWMLLKIFKSIKVDGIVRILQRPTRQKISLIYSTRQSGAEWWEGKSAFTAYSIDVDRFWFCLASNERSQRCILGLLFIWIARIAKLFTTRFSQIFSVSATALDYQRKELQENSLPVFIGSLVVCLSTSCSKFPEKLLSSPKDAKSFGKVAPFRKVAGKLLNYCKIVLSFLPHACIQVDICLC